MKLQLNGAKNLCNEDSFVSMLILDGNLTIEYLDGEIEGQKGDSVFVPAGFCVRLKGNAEILYSYV